MKCDDVFELILDGRPLTEEMQDHVGRCEHCSELVATVAALDEAGAEERERDMSPKKVQETISLAGQLNEERLSPPHMKMKEWWLVQRLTAAAAIVLAVGLAVIVAQRLMPSKEDPAPVTAAVDFSTVNGADTLRAEVEKDVSSFMVRHYAADDKDGLQAEFAVLRSRMNLASVGLERELSAFNY